MSIDIETNYNKSVTVQRFDPDDSGDGESYVNYLSNVKCHIQPLDESFTEDLSGHFGKDFLMFCQSQDILEQDKIVDGSDVYVVVGLEKFAFLGQTRHMELRIRKQND